MNPREKAIALRVAQLCAVLALLTGGVAALAHQAGETAMLGIPSRLFYGIIGGATAIYVALAFSKFMFKNLPSAYPQGKDEPLGPSTNALAKYEQVKYSDGKKATSQGKGFDKYYTPLPTPREKN